MYVCVREREILNSDFTTIVYGMKTLKIISFEKKASRGIHQNDLKHSICLQLFTYFLTPKSFVHAGPCSLREFSL